MKKFICLFLFSLLSSGLFAKDFIIHDCYSLHKDIHQMVFLTQEKNGAQYSVMVVFKNQTAQLTGHDYCGNRDQSPLSKFSG